ncbi:hypothetical protein Poli38472_005895 [Pythium oligandrum]|uniref:F-box domain-containing protein n=1 Tax=Pythium oligandrum TaxID=41045 RepID=A0A8K1CTE3_PYTOL|nr:hypothetical protein Poli38472_005895 [Pythium oligandrum]|eukprot:TMW68427.1 hypothetical protein Poli38472_005895 [Pythium oligandrum]
MWRQLTQWASHCHHELTEKPPVRTSSRTSTRTSSWDGARAFEELPDGAVEVVFQYLDHAALHALELTSRFFRSTLQDTEFWSLSIQSLVAFYEDPEPHKRQQMWKMMHCLRREKGVHLNDTLLTSVVACSTTNPHSVPPAWLLFKSRCWFWMEKLLRKTTAIEVDDASMFVRQLHCGCAYHVPCFWASACSRSNTVCSYIDFHVKASCFITSIQVVPYQAYWLEGHPSFAPKQVSFSVLHQSEPTDDTLVEFYKSSAFDVDNEMKLQTFELPKAIWTGTNGVLRVHLLGRYQTAPVAERPWIPSDKTDSASEDDTSERPLEYFYCCLSYVNASGVEMPIHVN